MEADEMHTLIVDTPREVPVEAIPGQAARRYDYDNPIPFPPRSPWTALAAEVLLRLECTRPDAGIEYVFIDARAARSAATQLRRLMRRVQPAGGVIVVRREARLYFLRGPQWQKME